MLPIPATLESQSLAAGTKENGLNRPGRFLVSGMLAGAYMGIGVVLMLSAAGPLFAAEDGFGKLISGVVFGTALTLTVFAGAELATSAMMILPIGTLTGRVKAIRATGTLAFIFIANLLGSVAFALLVFASGLVRPETPGGAMMQDMLATKAAETPLELFTRGILCNVLVCLAIWMASRVEQDLAKIAVIFIAITAFVVSGYEHVIANMTTYSLGLLMGLPNATWFLFGNNLVWVGLGNVAGGIIVALAYWIVAGKPHTRDAETLSALSPDSHTR